ncbi:transposable element Tcb2 transposase [Trichonephila clavipes]|nr:transposable element Tcb2 transposase [Trichonephila clavipes]
MRTGELAVIGLQAKRNRRSTASDLSRPLSSATSMTVSRQTLYRRLGHIGLYARRFSLQSDSRRTSIWRVWRSIANFGSCAIKPQIHSLTQYGERQVPVKIKRTNTIDRHRYGGAGCLVWGGIILGSRTDLHVQSETLIGHIYRDVILEQHARLFRGAMGAELLFMDENGRPQRANIVDERLQSEDITRMD